MATESKPRRLYQQFLKSFRQLTESVDRTLKGRLDVGCHGKRTFTGVITRVPQRPLAYSAAI
jgi:hypothetical protein